MGNCEFVKEFSKLRKSSKDSVDNSQNFDEFKKYMHVTRQIEEDLKDILRYVNNTKKNSLVLLCGSAGDGKSHLLSYLNNTDQENLLRNYFIYNDATESYAPNKSAIDTLNELLDEYSDENLSNKGNPSRNIILAINLGVLNNFIESEYGNRYGMLKQYVEEREILTSSANSEVISYDSYFQSINFSDYHLFNLINDGTNEVFINSLLDKVFGDYDGNPFFRCYTSNCCCSCVKSRWCPVKHNYELLMIDNCQKYISQLLVECIVKDKVILTTRELQNFLYDIVVPIGFEPMITMDATDTKRRINTYFSSLTPSLLFEQKDTSVIGNIIKKYDPLNARSEKVDEEATEFYVANNVIDFVTSAFKNTPYNSFIIDKQIFEKISADKIYRSTLFVTIKRCQSFLHGQLTDALYKEFLVDLYRYNSNRINQLNDLYESVEKAVKQWCGTDDDENLCIESNKLGYEVYETVDFNPYSDGSNEEYINGELNRFVNYIVVKFENENSDELISLVIDFSLYQLIKKLSNGYVQTSEDRNNHADFLTFIKKIKNAGSEPHKVIIKGPNGDKIVFRKKSLGYTYKIK